jgi:hypothetical protein
LPDGTFSNPNPDSGKFWWAFKWKIFYVHVVYFMSMWYILCPFGIFYGTLVYFTAIWYIFWSFVIIFPFCLL